MTAHSLEIYKTRAGQWRWRIRARNGKIIDAATESFTRYTACLANMGDVFPFCPPKKWKRGTVKWSQSL